MRNHTAIGLLALCLCSRPSHSHACSNFLFDKNGNSLLAHNMDWVSGEGMVVINKRHVQKRGFQVENIPEFTWTSKYGSMTLSFDGREITGRGMNEAGLVILEAALSETQQSGGSLPLLSVGQWVQYQLDTSATVEDVIASDKVVRIWPGDLQSHFLIWDRSGTPAVIEWLGGEMTVYRGDTLPIPAIVNSPYAACLASGDDPSGRFKKLVHGLDTYDATTASDDLGYVYSILRDVSDMLSPPVRTLWSVVFDARALRLYFSTVQNSQLRYVDLKDFDFSCQTDVEVLDINGAGSGDVRSAFVPYTTAFNNTIVRRTYDIYSSYGYTTSEDELNRIISFPESTTCTEGGAGGAVGGSGGSMSGGGASGAPNNGRTGGDACVGGEGGGQPQVSGGGGGGAAGADAAGAGVAGAVSTANGGSGISGEAGTGSGSTASGGESSSCSCKLVGSARGSQGLVGLLLCLSMAAGRRGSRTQKRLPPRKRAPLDDRVRQTSSR